MAGTPSPPLDEVLFEQAACGLVVTGVDGTILRANARFCVWLGCDTAALAGRLRRAGEGWLLLEPGG